jgi:hypothetical protein
VVAWGGTELPPEAGLAVYVRGDSGKLAAARVYDDSDPPHSARLADGGLAAAHSRSGANETPTQSDRRSRGWCSRGSNRSTHWACQAGGSQGSPK